MCTDPQTECVKVIVCEGECVKQDMFGYFDYAAGSPMRREALEAYVRHAEDDFGNPSSLHGCGERARKTLERSRAAIAGTIGATAQEIVFTGTGTEANNLAVLGAARRMRRLGRGSGVVVSAVEHPSVREACRALAREGFSVMEVGVDETGRARVDELRAAVRPGTVLVSLMHANNVVGTLQPVEEAARIAHAEGALLHVDAVQSYGKVPVDIRRLGADLLTLNAHKIGGPKGVGALWARRGTRLDPPFFGGGHERGLRPGTQNVPGIVAFAVAAEAAAGELDRERARLSGLRKRLVERLLDRIPEVRINGPDDPDCCLPTFVNLGVRGIEGQALMLELDRRGFCASSGSACSASESRPSYVLTAMGQEGDTALESLRATLGAETSEASVDAFIAALELSVSFWRRTVRR